jgi:hypothetical protein
MNLNEIFTWPQYFSHSTEEDIKELQGLRRCNIKHHFMEQADVAATL